MKKRQRRAEQRDRAFRGKAGLHRRAKALHIQRPASVHHREDKLAEALARQRAEHLRERGVRRVRAFLREQNHRLRAAAIQPIPPCQHRRIVEPRVDEMMLAETLTRRPARAKRPRDHPRRRDREPRGFERALRHGGNLPPVHGGRARRAKIRVGRVPALLESVRRQRQRIEFRLAQILAQCGEDARFQLAVGGEDSVHGGTFYPAPAACHSPKIFTSTRW